MSENFEQQVKHLLDEVQLEPQAGVWHNVKEAIQPVKRKRRFIFWWLLPLALTAGSLVYFVNNNNEDGRPVSKPTVPAISKANQTNTVDQPVPFFEEHLKERSERGNELVDREIPSIANQNVKTNSQNNINEPSPPVTNKTETVVASNGKNDIPVGEPGSTSQESISITKQPGTNDTAAESVIKPEPKTAVNDTINSVVNVSAEKTPSKRSKWSFGVTADVSNTIAAGGDLFGNAKKESAFVNLGSPSGPASGISSNMYQRTTSGGRFSFGVYFTGARELSRTISLQSSLGYRQQSFSITHSTMKDSIVAGSLYTFPVNSSTIKYRSRFVNLYTGISFTVAQLNELKLGIAAGVDNQVMLSAKRNALLMNNAGFSNDKSTSLDGYNKWQPLLRFQLVTTITNGNSKWLQLSPYFNYALRSFEQQPSTNKDRMAAFGVTATYFFR